MKLGVILGDQLSESLATLRALDKGQDRLLMAELAAEATYVPHHKQKIALLFSAMRHFAQVLRAQGWQVDYFAFDEHDHTDFTAVIRHLAQHHKLSEIIVVHPGEYRLLALMHEHWADAADAPLRVLDDDRFICTGDRFQRWAKGRKQLRMEYFYRDMRRLTGLLMAGNEPAGGQWNYDADNRKPLATGAQIPPPPTFERDEIDTQVVALVRERFARHPGSLDQFSWGTTREQALAALAHFITHRLPNFGDFQDAMRSGEDYLYHSLLSPYLNCGLLTPMEVCTAAEQAWLDGHAPINAVEGFIRQIIGWREYVRGIYWLTMPEYARENRLANDRPLPGMYWHGRTDMHCMSECLRNTFENGYAHHIQRLMVTGNFALLTGIAPDHICAWYLAVYVDAYDWVELPNTLGMVMHADGGYLGSKPYAASGSYINRMSDYCKHCRYNVRTADAPDSCPFNSLYWHFMHRHRDRFASNPRMGMVYRNLDRMDAGKVDGMLQRADTLLADLDNL